MTTRRLDVALVSRGLARSRGDAGDLVRAGAVLCNGAIARKPAQPVAAADALSVTARARRVGRAAYKLEAAFDVFGAASPAAWSVAGRRCLDVGASTGGFTQVLLDHGAAHVVALDVGHDQLAPQLRADPRVTDVPGRSIRGIGNADIAELGGPFDVVVADLSFISLRLVAPELARAVSADGQGVFLVKPQFEVGRARLGKNGVVREPSDQVAAVLGVLAALRAAGLPPRAVEPTRVPGEAGNREYLVWASTQTDLAQHDDEAATTDAVRRFEGRR